MCTLEGCITTGKLSEVKCYELLKITGTITDGVAYSGQTRTFLIVVYHQEITESLKLNY